MLFSNEYPQLGPGAGQRLYFVAVIPGTAAATAANYGSIFTADRPIRILEIREIHETAGSDAGAVTLDITKDTGTNSPGAGTSVIASGTFNLKGTANTLQTKAAKTNGVEVLAAGDRLGLKDGGTLTAVAGLQVTVIAEVITKEGL